MAHRGHYRYDQRALSKGFLRVDNTHTRADGKGRVKVCLTRGLFTCGAAHLIKQCFEIGPVTLEAGGVYIGRVVGNHLHSVLLSDSGLSWQHAWNWWTWDTP